MSLRYVPRIRLLFAIFLRGYLSVGVTGSVTRHTLSYRFVHIHSDPIFTILSTLIAFFVYILTGSIICLGMMYEPEESGGIFALLAAVIGFGLAASLLRFLTSPAMRFGLRWIT